MTKICGLKTERWMQNKGEGQYGIKVTYNEWCRIDDIVISRCRPIYIPRNHIHAGDTKRHTRHTDTLVGRRVPASAGN